MMAQGQAPGTVLCQERITAPHHRVPQDDVRPPMPGRHRTPSWTDHLESPVTAVVTVSLPQAPQGRAGGGGAFPIPRALAWAFASAHCCII